MTVSILVLWGKCHMHSEVEFSIKSDDNVQFYSVPNIDNSMNRLSQKVTKGAPRQERGFLRYPF